MAKAKITYKLGANRKELARKKRKHHPNIAQSRDIREDRGERQIKMVILTCTVREGTR